MGAAHRMIQKDQPMQALKGRDTFPAKSDTLSRSITPLQGWGFLKSDLALKGRHTKAMGAAHRLIQKTNQCKP
jgi:hypothetical protein